MTDEQILIELARRVHGWHIAPADDRQAWFDDDANYPCYDPRTRAVGEKPRGTPWRDWSPLIDWNDAMGLAEKWIDSPAGDWYELERLPGHGYYAYMFPSDDGPVFYSAVDPSGPRAVTMAVARAVGIEVEG